MKKYSIYTDDFGINVEVDGDKLKVISSCDDCGWPLIGLTVEEAK